jgi:hypothetical protein
VRSGRSGDRPNEHGEPSRLGEVESDADEVADEVPDIRKVLKERGDL